MEQEVKKKNNKKKIIITIITLIIIVSLVIILFIRLKDKKEDTNKTKTTNVKKLYSDYRMSGNGLENFDLRFLQLENDNNNVIYSPLSIKYALAMLSEGAKGETKDQIDALIGDYEAKKYINSANMSFANALFVKEPYKNMVKESYKNNLKKKFNAEIIYDSFEDPSNINKWISDKTFNLINDFIDDVSEKQFILTNALAIDMEWKQQLQADYKHLDNSYSITYDHEDYSTYIDPISTDYYGSIYFNNNKIKASEIGASLNNYDIISDLGEDNIRQTITKEYEQWVAEDHCGTFGQYEATDSFVDKFIKELDSNYKREDVSTDFRYYVNDDVKVFAKELKEYDETTLEYIGIMPTKQNLSDYIKNIDAKKINNIINNLKDVNLDNVATGKVTKIIGGIPLFKYDYQLDLEKNLKSLGITNIFDKDKIDVSNIAEDKEISFDASHKANIEFSNDGIKAAAVTELGGLGSATCEFEHLYKVPVEIIDLTFDKPYLYLIRDKDSNEVWFIGTVYEPIESSSNSYIINEK